jgi:ribosomal protein L37AE/L43A
MEQVKLIASAYDWTCPTCGTNNLEPSHTSIVQCQGCDEQFEADDPDHCRG